MMVMHELLTFRIHPCNQSPPGYGLNFTAQFSLLKNIPFLSNQISYSEIFRKTFGTFCHVQAENSFLNTSRKQRARTNPLGQLLFIMHSFYFFSIYHLISPKCHFALLILQFHQYYVFFRLKFFNHFMLFLHLLCPLTILIL